MVSSEIKETVAIAISAILLASLLYFVAYGLNQAYALSSAYNSTVHTESSLASYREFEKFQGNTVLGGTDVIAAILEYAPNDLNVAVVITSTNIFKYNKSAIDSKQVNTTYSFLRCIYQDSPKSAVCPVTSGYTMTAYQTGSGSGYYDVYLLYGGVSVDEMIQKIRTFRGITNPTGAQIKEFNATLKGSVLDGNVTGIVFYKK